MKRILAVYGLKDDIYITELITGLQVIAWPFIGERSHEKLTFEIRSPAHQQNAIHAVQQILPDPTKPIM